MAKSYQDDRLATKLAFIDHTSAVGMHMQGVIRLGMGNKDRTDVNLFLLLSFSQPPQTLSNIPFVKANYQISNFFRRAVHHLRIFRLWINR